MRIILAAAALSCAVGARAVETAREFPAAGLSGLSVEVSAGEVEIEAGTGGVRAEATHVDSERCRLTMAPKDGVLILKAETKARTGVFRKGCEAGFKVSAPAGLRVSVDSGAGSITLKGVAGEVKAQTGAGSIAGTLRSAAADVRTGAGSIALTWTVSPAAGVIKAASGAGSVEVALPAGTKIDADLSTGVGSLRNELGNDPGAPLRVRASSGVGRVAVVKS